jgi:hypothetical protein
MHSTVNMIAIAFLNHRTSKGLVMKMFSNEVDAKVWLIDNLIDDILLNWSDEDGDYWKPNEIKDALQKRTLNEIIEGARDCSFDIDMVSSNQ